MAAGVTRKKRRSAKSGQSGRGGTAAYIHFERWLELHPILALAVVAAAAVAAHAGCLWSTFYMDDWWQIANSPFVEGGRWWASGVTVVTTLSYWLTWRLAGLSAPAFHAGNLLLHVTFALTIALTASVFFESARDDSADAIRMRRTIAWFAALVFATHPLATEITNYARARDHAFVAFFSYLIAVAALHWIRNGWRWAPALVLCAAAATFSKGPGVGHVAVSVALVWIFYSRAADWRTRFPTYREIIAAAGVVLICAIAVLRTGHWVHIIQAELRHPWLGWHALTQMRVIWRYFALLLWPGQLCSDHLVAITRSFSDFTAWAGAAAVAGSIAVIVVAARRGYRRIAFLLAAIFASLLLRCTYVISELMVEYRVYPALPWFAMIAGWGLFVSARRWSLPASVGIAALLAAYVFRSELRAADWRNPDAIAASILRIYPWQLRAYVELGNARLRERNYKAVEKLYAEFSPKLAAVMRENATQSPRYYQNWPLWAVSFDGARIDARTHLNGPAAGRVLLDQLKRRMDAAGLNEPVYQSRYHWAASIVAAAEGNTAVAEAEFAAAQGMR